MQRNENGKRKYEKKKNPRRSRGNGTQSGNVSGTWDRFKLSFGFLYGSSQGNIIGVWHAIHHTQTGENRCHRRILNVLKKVYTCFFPLSPDKGLPFPRMILAPTNVRSYHRHNICISFPPRNHTAKLESMYQMTRNWKRGFLSDYLAAFARLVLDLF
jgi:hypothetical protein